MDETTMSALHAWETFYVIVGSSAGALTGLQFVVLTLITESGVIRGSSEALAAFGSPNVVHFCLALLVSAILSAPWHGLGTPGIAAALCGAGGLAYACTVLRRAVRQKDYKPVLEDWIWHTALPFIAYVVLTVAAVTLPRAATASLFAIAASELLLLFIGIHNAWDAIAYHVFVTIRKAREGRK